MLFPVFAGGKLVIPQNTLLQGMVIALLPDKTARWHARLRADFTPFHMADVRFNDFMQAAGPVAIATGGAAIGSPMVQKLPEISIEAICGPERECSRVKSSTKVSLPARVASGLISEELALPDCSTGLDERRPLLRLTHRRLFEAHFLRRFIAAPMVQLRT